MGGWGKVRLRGWHEGLSGQLASSARHYNIRYILLYINPNPEDPNTEKEPLMVDGLQVIMPYHSGFTHSDKCTTLENAQGKAGAVDRREGCVHLEVKSERETLYFPVKLSASLHCSFQLVLFLKAVPVTWHLRMQKMFGL